MTWQEFKEVQRNTEAELRLLRAALHTERAYRIRLEKRLEAVERNVFMHQQPREEAA